MMNTFSKVRELVMSLEDDFEKFYDKKNQAAGTRVRKGMQELKNMATEIRKSVQDMKNESSGSSAGAAKSGGAKAGGAKAGAAKGKK
ncbi:MAG: hypothetical protein EOP53_25140 [Sphingobacteriales bacterium]|nr:MAG: hypothetical protein EOP53_25140 [Sphingobacteriales bacterium]